ncbi:MAG: hypothetical protein ABIO04_13770 [Ferruginibacter sp.]
MAISTKITLSDKELSMAMDAEWILTKQAIIQKVYDMFATCIPAIKDIILERNAAIPEEVIYSIPKIYKGENYLQLPYVMLDYPRCFNGADTFAVRTMFWWGNFFSITLHLAGEHKKHLQEKILYNEQLLHEGFYIGVNEDQWHHHFQADNYMLWPEVLTHDRSRLLTENNFIKLALMFRLEQWNQMPEILKSGYSRIAGILS